VRISRSFCSKTDIRSEVFGLDRRTSTSTTERLCYLDVADRVTLLDGDVTDQGSFVRALEVAEPDEVSNLAAQSFVGSSWWQPVLTTEVNAIGAVNVLEANRRENPKTRFYQASTGEYALNAASMLLRHHLSRAP
jgi:GDPmannose 4,6-dehydratase